MIYVWKNSTDMSATTGRTTETTNNKKLAEVFGHGFVGGNVSGKREKLASCTLSDLQRDGKFSQTLQESKSYGKNTKF